MVPQNNSIPDFGPAQKRFKERNGSLEPMKPDDINYGSLKCDPLTQTTIDILTLADNNSLQSDRLPLTTISNPEDIQTFTFTRLAMVEKHDKREGISRNVMRNTLVAKVKAITAPRKNKSRSM